LKTNEEKMKENSKKLHAQRLFWKPNSIIALCWAFYFANDNKEVDVTNPQVMHCILCQNSLVLNSNPKIQAKRGLIIYNTTNGIVELRKHVNSNHCKILKKIEEEVNNPLREDEKRPSK